MIGSAWPRLRTFLRQSAWLGASLPACIVLLAGAAKCLSSWVDAPYPGVGHTFLQLTVFFAYPSLFVCVFCWLKLAARFPSLESSWTGLMQGTAAVVGLTFVLPVLLLGGLGTSSGLRTLGYAGLGAFLVWVALILPRLILPGVRMGSFAREVDALGVRPAGWGSAIAASGALLLFLLVVFPNYVRFAQRSRFDEARLNLAAIQAAEESYFREFGTYLAAGPHPTPPPGADKQAWRLREDEGVAEFDRLGWEPEPDGVRCLYAVAVEPDPSTGADATAFSAAAICDIDGDGIFASWGIVRPRDGSKLGIPGPFGLCPRDGVLGPSDERIFGEVGPCDERSGKTVF